MGAESSAIPSAFPDRFRRRKQRQHSAESDSRAGLPAIEAKAEYHAATPPPLPPRALVDHALRTSSETPPSPASLRLPSSSACIRWLEMLRTPADPRQFAEALSARVRGVVRPTFGADVRRTFGSVVVRCSYSASGAPRTGIATRWVSDPTPPDQPRGHRGVCTIGTRSSGSPAARDRPCIETIR